MVIDLEHSVVIDRPVNDVFDFVADQRNEAKWHTDVLEARPESRLEPGSRVTWLIKFMGEEEYTAEVTGFDEGRMIQLTGREGPLKPTLTHTFAPVDGGTRYTRHVQIPAKGLFRVVGPIMKATGASDKRNAGFAQNLKQLLEV